jgi:hypothetical protein
VDWYVPATQLAQVATAVIAMPVLYRPALQTVHTDAVVVDWYVPAAQLAHVPAVGMPVPVLYLPTPQLLHTDVEVPV